ncbi:YqzL-like protein [Moorella glycerini]|uniref:YqzL-like protein n=1 Tax=Neomoorella stamsii TaxID=1266720 RepID=A0A9X7P7G9_9FIRM|nr:MULTISPECIES: hypothetical protein [Moorella]PRR77471.1 hypothetical protein MOST_02210 [Moorella stamsii]CEP68220.1 YqzL-like protein [Moorella glycerini]
MKISEAWWHLFTLTGSIEAYLLYRGILEPVASSPPVAGKSYGGKYGFLCILEPDGTPPVATGPSGTSCPQQG